MPVNWSREYSQLFFHVWTLALKQCGAHHSGHRPCEQAFMGEECSVLAVDNKMKWQQAIQP